MSPFKFVRTYNTLSHGTIEVTEFLNKKKKTKISAKQKKRKYKKWQKPRLNPEN